MTKTNTTHLLAKTYKNEADVLKGRLDMTGDLSNLNGKPANQTTPNLKRLDCTTGSEEESGPGWKSSRGEVRWGVVGRNLLWQGKTAWLQRTQLSRMLTCGPRQNGQGTMARREGGKEGRNEGRMEAMMGGRTEGRKKGTKEEESREGMGRRGKESKVREEVGSKEGEEG